MAKSNPKTAPVLALLQEGQLTFEEIAKKAGVSVNVVHGVNSVFKQGLYKVNTRLIKGPKLRSPRTDRGWTYYLVSTCGITYLGATTDLRQRLRSHNSASNTGWTRGRRWRLLGAMRFDSRREAFEMETWMKRSGKPRGEFLEKCLSRAARLAQRLGFPPSWLEELRAKSQAWQGHSGPASDSPRGKLKGRSSGGVSAS